MATYLPKSTAKAIDNFSRNYWRRPISIATIACSSYTAVLGISPSPSPSASATSSRWKAIVPAFESGKHSARSKRHHQYSLDLLAGSRRTGATEKAAPALLKNRSRPAAQWRQRSRSATWLRSAPKRSSTSPVTRLRSPAISPPWPNRVTHCVLSSLSIYFHTHSTSRRSQPWCDKPLTIPIRRPSIVAGLKVLPQKITRELTKSFW